MIVFTPIIHPIMKALRVVLMGLTDPGWFAGCRAHTWECACAKPWKSGQQWSKHGDSTPIRNRQGWSIAGGSGIQQAMSTMTMEMGAQDEILNNLHSMWTWMSKMSSWRQGTQSSRMCAAKWTVGSLLGQHRCVHFRCIGLASLWHWTNRWLSFVTTPHCIGFWQVPLCTNWPQINLTILLDWMPRIFLIEKTSDLGKHHHARPSGVCSGQACSLTCGSGTRKRSRTVQVVANDLGKDCVTCRPVMWAVQRGDGGDGKKKQQCFKGKAYVDV